jgi:alpha 1,2-mannosyltransferase
LAQKRHSSYGRDSAAIFQKSLKLLYKNYLSDPKHMNKTDVFIFHTGDFNQTDLLTIESLLGPASRGAVHLVDLSRSEYWARPKANAMDDPTSWYAFPLFSEGYRRMMHWYAIDIWRFFRDYNEGFGCQYRYLFRLDEDSFIHSKISYDIFDLFASKRYVYGYRLCAYEMAVARRMWSRWRRKYPDFVPIRELDYKICGFYNNLFVADLDFFNSPEVSRFLDFIDGHGHIYRRRLGDLMIHTMAVIAFAPMDRVHRFLDFTYEHSTFDNKNGCLAWGGIQAGYDDRNASEIMNDFYRTKILGSNCSVNATYLSEQDLSPSYSHLPADRKGRVQLHTLVRGWVETSDGKGILSG